MKGKLILALNCLAGASFAIVPNAPIASFPGIGKMCDTNGATVITQGTAFAISPFYIMTASHVGGNKFEQNGVIYPVLQTISHPTADICVKRVGTPLFTALPLKTNFFPGGVPTVQTNLAGDIFRMQGYGWTSDWSPTGFPFQANNEGTLRQCRNRLDLFMPNVTVDLGGGNMKTTDYLMYDLDDPTGQSTVNTLGGPAVGADEGGMWTFDSGCPWTIDENSRPRAVAVGGIVGTFQGSGVTRPLNWGGFGGGANIQTYASWISANVPDLGRAILGAPVMIVGGLQSGTAANLYNSDNVTVSTSTNRSIADFVDSMVIQITGNTTASPANTLSLTIEGKTNSSLSVVKIELKSVASGQWVEVSSFLAFAVDSTTNINISSPNTYIAPSGDVQMRIKATPLGDDMLFYKTFWDVVRINAS